MVFISGTVSVTESFFCWCAKLLFDFHLAESVKKRHSYLHSYLLCCCSAYNRSKPWSCNRFGKMGLNSSTVIHWTHKFSYGSKDLFAQSDCNLDKSESALYLDKNEFENLLVLRLTEEACMEENWKGKTIGDVRGRVGKGDSKHVMELRKLNLNILGKNKIWKENV